MNKINMSPRDFSILRKTLPIICLLVPWEVYFYTSDFSKGWGLKFSVFYANFDSQYGTLFVNLVKQLGMLSYGGLLPSIRTIAWFMAALISVILLVYELSKEELDFELKNSTVVAAFIACSALTLISSMAVWNASFKAIPIAPVFFALGAYLLLQANNPKED